MTEFNKQSKYHFNLYSYDGPPHNSSSVISSTSYEIVEQALILNYIHPTDNVIELGANIGTSSVLLSKLLNNSTKQHVAVEPNVDIIPVLERNRMLNSSLFNIAPGIVSPAGDFYLEGDGWSGHIVDYKTNRKVDTFDFYELDSKYNFNVLFADCEGSLLQFIMNYPTIGDKLRLVIYERDGDIDYTVVDAYFTNHDFESKFDNGHHCVMQKINN